MNNNTGRKNRMGYARRASFRAILLLSVLALVGAGITAAQPAKAVPDLKSIAGKWSGTGHSSSGTNALEWTIKEDGTVAIVVGTPSGPRTGVAKISVKDGAFFYESGTSSGIVSFHEEGGQRKLKYQAVMKRDNSRGGAELTAVK
jgi:hypothetical protein